MASLPLGLAESARRRVGLAFAMRNVAPLLLMCDSHDLGCRSTAWPWKGRTRMGGRHRALAHGGRDSPPRRRSSSTTTTRAASVSASRCISMHEQLIAQTRDLIDGCPCSVGLPIVRGP
jgi:hypothetical protein